MRIILALIIFIAISCRPEKHTENYKELILGDWEKIPAETTSDTINDIEIFTIHFPEGYNFSDNGTCEVKHGISDYDENTLSRRYFGTFTTYKILNNSLKMYNPIDHKWFSLKINKLAGDTLVLDSIRFIRKKYNISNVPDFDALAVSASPCFGSCPINDIIITSNGIITYRGRDYNIVNGNYSSKTSKEQFNNIMMRFKKADYMHLQNDYSAGVTDHATVSVVFIKDGKIVKSISDYAKSAPLDLIWAYEPVVYLSQQLKLTPLKVPEYLEARLFTSFETPSTSLYLTQAEAFYLSNKLQKGTIVSTQFDEKYFLTNHDMLDKITTDGRCYKLYFKDYTTKTIDIGYNFLENNLINKFEKKHE